MRMNKNFQKFLSVLVFVVLTKYSIFALNPTVSFNNGKECQNQEDWYGAIENYTTALQGNPSYGEAYFKLAECFYAIDEYELAITNLDSASKLIKNRPDIINLRGFCYIGLGKLSEANEIFLSVLKDFPNDVDARFGLAELNILNGRISGAEKEYKQALSRQNTNKKALLSLALVSDELGNFVAANNYINQALKYHSGNPEVYYFAAYLAVKQGNLEQGESRIRTAIHLQSDLDKAYKLLADILYKSNRFEECIEICKYRITLDRELSSAWFLRGLASKSLNRYEDAISYWQTGLSIDPNDEIMRSALELLALEYTDIEDPRREEWALFHIEKAKDYEKKFYSVQARYEYQRALRINPLNQEARIAYAELLLSDGFKESYLSQLQFISDQGEATQKILDTIEGYNSLLSNTLSVKWNINPFYLDKKRWNLGLYASEGKTELIHMDGTKIALDFIGDLFVSSNTINANVDSKNVYNFTAAFADARKKGYDYFCILDFTESEREVSGKISMYSGRNGNLVSSWDVYRTGNDRFVSALRYFVTKIESSLPTYGEILNRKNSEILVDIGKKDGLENEDTTEWIVVKKGAIKTADDGIGITFLESDILGYYSVEEIGEEMSSGTISIKGFYDKINVGDYIIPVDTVTPVEESLENEENNEKEVSADSKVREPVLLELLRNIKN